MLRSALFLMVLQNACVVPVRSKSGADHAAKWLEDTHEADLIAFLHSHKNPQFLDRVIQLTDVLHLGLLGTWMIMPRHMPIGSLTDLKRSDYYRLRPQLVEVCDTLCRAYLRLLTILDRVLPSYTTLALLIEI